MQFLLVTGGLILTLTAGVGTREVLSGKTQKYSMYNTGVSFTTPNSGAQVGEHRHWLQKKFLPLV
jgi:hypothetical protein